MSLVWQCARCGATNSGTDDQVVGHQPPETWLHISVPVRGSGGAKSRHPDVICDRCEDSLYEWFHQPEDGDQ